MPKNPESHKPGNDDASFVVPTGLEPARDDIEEKHQRLQIVSELMEHGVDLEHPGEIIAVHATSVESIQQLIQTGSLPTGTLETEGYIYFFRLDIPGPQGSGKSEDQSETEAIDDAMRSYGKIIAFRQSFCDELNLSEAPDQLMLFHSALRALFHQKLTVAITEKLSPDEIASFIENLSKKDILSTLDGEGLEGFFEQIGFENAIRTAAKAYSRKGVMIGFNKNLLDLSPVSVYEKSELSPLGGDDGWRVHVPNGLPIDLISGIEPLGDLEFEYLEGLQETV